ncbi:putative extracellular nuclease [Geosmithia morbida]|uniref:Extracellular nuclease n=1 Tax=Geosmithia morbida TaxID=1094350 RepID=A0A9P4YPN8_9HYPO|nr:putative extracellular nuclease [Geosmithia morbida]KAF4119443.1 putative extracellular nuclease [Geosmithia morbida]
MTNKVSSAILVTAASAASAVSIAEINGNTFLSPLRDQNVTGVRGLVTAINKSGLFLRSTEPDNDPATSEGLFVYGSRVAGQVAVGDVITLDGTVDEYRSGDGYVYLTELGSPANVVVASSGSEVVPLVVGVDTAPPPTESFSRLDEGGVFGLPNAVNLISEVNPVLDPARYGMDFWESLVGELVTVRDAYQVSRPDQYGDVWIRGDWKVTGLNAHGGVTMLEGDANPETIVVGTPLDGSSNPDDTRMGDYLGDVTGVVTYAYGFYRILPRTALSPIRNATSSHPAAGFESTRSCGGITVSNYNARNLAPDSALLPSIASQIVDEMLSPDIIFLQEILDNSGETDDGVTDGNATLAALVSAIAAASDGGVVYDSVEIPPLDKTDGGVPGGNIRVAYLYRPDVVELYGPNLGGALDGNEVLDGPVLSFNPGRIDPSNAAWDDSRKPLAAQWRAVDGGTDGASKPFFTVNVHFGSKGGSTSIHGDARPPVNQGVDIRQNQAEITATFIAQILEKDPSAAIIAAGDFNEFAQVQPLHVFRNVSGLLDLDDVTDMPPTERYTYLFDMNSQALDHMYVSPALAGEEASRPLYEHLHLNTWQNYDDQKSHLQIPH